MTTPDELVPDPQLCRELGITLMSWWRWQHDRRLADIIPPKIQIRGRNYRDRRLAEVMKRELVRQALSERKVASPDGGAQ
jgi:hypothetical protein